MKYLNLRELLKFSGLPANGVLTLLQNHPQALKIDKTQGLLIDIEQTDIEKALQQGQKDLLDYVREDPVIFEKLARVVGEELEILIKQAVQVK